MNKFLLDSLWLNYYRNYGSSTQQLAPFYMVGCEEYLNRHEQDGFYKIVSKLVRRITLKHFKMQQSTAISFADSGEYHIERVLLFFELLKCRQWPDHTPQLIVHDFERAFSHYEGLLQARRLGIALPTDRTPYQLKVHWVVKHIIDHSIMVRSGEPDLYQFYVDRYGRHPSHQVFARYQARHQMLELMILGGNLGYKFIGYTQPWNITENDRK